MKKLIVFAATIAIFAVLGVLHKTHAQAFRGVVIDQIAFSFDNVARGSEVKGSFKVIHDFQNKEQDITLYIRSLDFTSDGVSGVPQFIEKDALPERLSLSSWISFDKQSFTLTDYGDEEVVNFTINVPSNAEAGGKYAAILVGENPPDGSTPQGVALTKELGPLVFMTVEGELNPSIVSDDLYTLDINGKKKSFFDFPPVTIVSRLKNNGNIHAVPRGVIYVYKGANFQDYEVKYDLNTTNGYILPDSTREFVFDWSGGFIEREKQMKPNGTQEIVIKVNWDKLSQIRFGKYNVKLLYSFEDINGTMQTNEAETFFWVIPWPLIIILLLIIGIISLVVFLLGRIFRGKKEKNQQQTSSSPQDLS